MVVAGRGGATHSVTNNLAPQISMSLFERPQKGGFPSITFDAQHRIIPQISDIVGDIFYSGKLRNTPSTNDRELSTDICNHNQERLEIDSPVVLVTLIVPVSQLVEDLFFMRAYKRGRFYLKFLETNGCGLLPRDKS